jgi:Tfp pilus assembly protein PilN
MNLDLIGDIPSGQHPSQKKKLNMSSLIVGLLVIVAVGAFGFFMWQKLSLNKNIEKLNTSIQNTENEIQTLQGLNDEQGKQTRETVLRKALLFRTDWSQVMSAILKYETPQVQFLNFSSTEEQTISIDGEAKTIEDVAALMEKLEKNPEIKNPFVSTLAGQEKGDPKTRFRLVFELVLPSSHE